MMSLLRILKSQQESKSRRHSNKIKRNRQISLNKIKNKRETMIVIMIGLLSQKKNMFGNKVHKIQWTKMKAG